MSVTGHHSLNTLAIYEKVSTNEKLTMGMCMNYYLSTNNLQATLDTPVPLCTGPRPILPKTKPATTVSAPLADSTNTCQMVTFHPEVNPARNQQAQQSASSNENSMQLVPLQTEEEDPLIEDNDLPSDFDIMQYVAEIQNEANTMTTTQKKDGKEVTTTTSYQKTTKRSPNVPVFYNCKIGSITINIQK